MPLIVIVDDVGWWSGKNESNKGRPFRTGIERNHSVLDYKALSDIGRITGMRLQAATVLCEWDKDNLLATLPESTWMGEEWDNSNWVGSWLDDAAEIINNSENFFELTFHGLAHEYWTNGRMERSEFADIAGRMREKEIVKKHFDMYFKILQSNRIGVRPKSFVPPAFTAVFGRGRGGIANILSNYGIKYASTPFDKYDRKNFENPQGRWFGVDCGLIVVDRGIDLFKWSAIDTIPNEIVPGPVLGVHWPNILNPDPEKNSETVERWANYLMRYNYLDDRMLANNTADAFSQVVYMEKAKISEDETGLRFDFSEVDKLGAAGLNNYFFIKIHQTDRYSLNSPDVAFEDINNYGSQQLIKVKRQ